VFLFAIPAWLQAAEHLFVFATIADSHICSGAHDHTGYIKASSISSELLSNYVNDINHHDPPVDFVVHLGDATERGLDVEFRMLETIMSRLEPPLCAVVGNHDNFESDDKKGWKRFAGCTTTNYTFDYYGIHFVVIDCTAQPYKPPLVNCSRELREWVRHDLSENHDKPTVVLPHYNLWRRGWDARFDTTQSYAEYRGVPELRRVFRDAGNVVAVINGHVHANRVEVHDGICYVDISATLVGKPSIRYFYVYRDSIRVDYEYISDVNLFNQVAGLCTTCLHCFDKSEVCDFIDGEVSDKRFTIDLAIGPPSVRPPVLTELTFDVDIGDHGMLEATVSAEQPGHLELSLYNALGRRLDRWTTWKLPGVMSIDLANRLPRVTKVSDGVYFLCAKYGGQIRVRKLPIPAH
jgi:predicted phosphodiesterase